MLPYRTFPSPKGEGFTDPLAGTLRFLRGSAEFFQEGLVLVFFHGETVLGQRKLAFVHVFLEIRERLADDVPAIRIALDELRREAVEQADHVVQHQVLSVAVRTGTDADGRN